MSLLLDARKKAELALQQDSARQLASGEFNMGDAPRSAPQSSSGEAVFGGSNQRAAGQNLFNAKRAPASRIPRLGIVPIALISGLILAVAGGFYVWRELSPPPLAQRQTPPAPIANSPAAPIKPVAALALLPTPALAAADGDSVDALPAAQTRRKATTRKRPAAGSERSRRAPVTPASAQKAMADSTSSADAAANTGSSLTFVRGQESAGVDPALLAAYQSYRNGDLDNAMQSYQEVLRGDAKNRDALLGLAAIAQQRGQDRVAANYYKQLLDQDPRDPVALAGMSALASANGGDAASNETRIKLLLAQQPHSADAQSAALHFVLGNNYAAQARWGDAQQAYFNAYNLDPGNAQIAFNLAVSLDHLQQSKLAANYYQRALQLDSAEKAGFDRAQTQLRINELTAR